MKNQPTFGPRSRARLSDRIEYEMWLLEAAYAIEEEELFPHWPDSVVYPVDRSQAQFFANMRGNIVIGDWRPGFLSAAAPLVFVTTFKLLDMLVEWVLEENGTPSTFRFQQKLQHLRGSPAFPPVVASRPWLEERLLGLYANLEPLRGTIIHDRHFTSTDGAIRVRSSKGNVVGPEVEIGAARLKTLATAMVSVVKYVLQSWAFNEYREKVLRHGLDELVELHGEVSLGQLRPFYPTVRVYVTGPSPVSIDPAVIRDDMAQRYKSQDCMFDLRVLRVEGQTVVDAFLFPWRLVNGAGPNWGARVDIEAYRTTIPDDVKPEHLRPGDDS